MPFKDSEEFLTDCLESIIAQSFIDWELIAVDDHSTDGSLRLLNSFVEKDDRIKLFQNTGQGIISALQTGLAQSSGQYITRIDSDDIMPKMRLEWMINQIKKSSPNTVVTGLVSYFSNKKVSAGYRKYECWLNETNQYNLQWERIYRECVIASPNWMISNDTLLNLGGFENLQYPEDYDLVLNWYRAKLNIKTIPEVTLHWREHPKRTSRNSELYNQESFFKLKINHFVDHDWNGEKIVVWGKNQKTKLARQIIKNRNIAHSIHSIKEFEKLEKLKNSQVLVGVFPPKDERISISNYLNSTGRKEGSHWWWI